MTKLNAQIQKKVLGIIADIDNAHAKQEDLLLLLTKKHAGEEWEHENSNIGKVFDVIRRTLELSEYVKESFTGILSEILFEEIEKL